MVTKEQTFKALIESEIRKALKEVYGVKALDLTEKQQLLTEKISNAIYRIVGKNMTVEEFKQRFYENISPTIQKE